MKCNIDNCTGCLGIKDKHNCHGNIGWHSESCKNNTEYEPVSGGGGAGFYCDKCKTTGLKYPNHTCPVTLVMSKEQTPTPKVCPECQFEIASHTVPHSKTCSKYEPSKNPEEKCDDCRSQQGFCAKHCDKTIFQVSSCDTWQEQEREAFHKKAQAEFWSLTLGQEEDVSNYLIFRIELARKEATIASLSNIKDACALARVDTLSEVEEMLKGMKVENSYSYDAQRGFDDTELNAYNICISDALTSLSDLKKKGK